MSNRRIGVSISGVVKFGLVAVAGISLIGTSGCGGGGSSSTDASSSSTASNTAPTMPGPGGMGMMGPGGMGGYGATGTAAATPAPVVKVSHPATYHYGQDPFFVTWRRKPLPPDPFQQVQPLQVASTTVMAPPSQPVHVREVADRRVAGILTGKGVFAILEKDGQSEIVKPGQMTSDGYKVVAITTNSVKLRKQDGNIIITQVVPLTDQSTSAVTPGYQQGGYGGRGYGGPGMGNRGFGGGPAMPGAPGMGGPGFGGYPGGPGGPGGAAN